MPRPRLSDQMSIAKLESMLRARKGELSVLQKHRDQLHRKLNNIEKRIVSLGGTVRAGGGRARNSMSLVEALQTVLSGAKPMKVGDIVEAVQRKGYSSSSANFRGIVNQTLIKEKQFGSVGRGVYQLKS
jgi:hypothetical protein